MELLIPEAILLQTGLIGPPPPKKLPTDGLGDEILTKCALEQQKLPAGPVWVKSCPHVTLSAEIPDLRRPTGHWPAIDRAWNKNELLARNGSENIVQRF